MTPLEALSDATRQTLDAIETEKRRQYLRRLDARLQELDEPQTLDQVYEKDEIMQDLQAAYEPYGPDRETE